MAQIVKGTDAFSEQPQQDTFEQGSGRTTNKIWRGPRDLYEAKFAEIQATAPDSMRGIKGTPAEIQATYLPIDPEQELAVWELIPTPIDRPLSTHPSFNSSSGLQDYIEQIEKALAEGVAGDTDWDAESGYSVLNDFKNLKMKGVDSYRMWSYVVRRTLNTALAGIEQANSQDAGLVVDWAGIGIPGSVKFAQPTYNKFDINGGPPEAVPIDQWLVTPETVRYERKRYSIVKEWIGALGWYSILYSGGNVAAEADGSSLG